MTEEKTEEAKASEPKGKLEIEDIKDPNEKVEAIDPNEELDIEFAVLEEESVPDDEENLESNKSEESKEEDIKEELSENSAEDLEEIEEKENSEPDDNRDVLEKNIEESEVTEKEEAPELGKKSNKKETKLKHKRVKRTSGNKNWVKIAIVILITVLITAAAILGGMYYLDQKNKSEETETVQEEAVDETAEEPIEEVVESNVAYISSVMGLNLREEPNTQSKVLIIIPFGIEIEVLEEESGWIKTEYDGKTGWVSADYTQKTDPLIYKNDTYGFSMTFKPSWAGYKVIQEKLSSNSTVTATYSVFVPTTDSSWAGVDTLDGEAYYNPFIISIFAPIEWAKIENGDGPKPSIIEENDKYVFVYSRAQDAPKDFIDNFDEPKDIIDTFKFL